MMTTATRNGHYTETDATGHKELVGLWDGYCESE